MTVSDERTSLAPLTPIAYRSELIYESDPVHAGPAHPQFWEIVAIRPLLRAIYAQSLVFRKDRTYAAIDSDGKELWGGTFDLDPKASPKIWDHRSTEMQKQGRDALEVYELEGDKLKVCCAVRVCKDRQWTGKPRPAELRLPGADTVLELRRIPASK